MAMTVAQCRTAVRTVTAQDLTASPQITSGAAATIDLATQLDTIIDQEYRRLRRELVAVIPTLYIAVESPFTLTAGQDTHGTLTDYERVVRFERLVGARWFDVPVASEPGVSQPRQASFLGVSYRESGATTPVIIVSPVELAPGTYRLTYHQKPVASYSTLDVPEGVEDVIVHRAAAQVRMRFDEDPSPHVALASTIWDQQRRDLRRRYGGHPMPGLRVVRGY